MKTEINTKKPKSKEIAELVADMPYFTVSNLSSLNVEKYYLNILLSRLRGRGEIVSLKRGVYVPRKYLEKLKRHGNFNDYIESMAGFLYSPSYLGAEYVLAEYNILTEAVFSFSLVTTKKTFRLRNDLGNFNYYSIKKDLFEGFRVIKKGNFFIYKATLAKAMFDFLYFRKNDIVDKNYFQGLRLNLENFRHKDITELHRYVKKEGSDKMKEIFKFLKEEK